MQQCLLFHLNTNLLGTHFPHRMFMFVFQSVATVSGCLVQTMPSLTLERMSFNSPRPTTKHKWDISTSFLFHPKTNAIQILDNWSFYDRLPCHGVTRFPGVLKPRHSETGGGGCEGGLLLQLLVPHLLPAAFWHWYGRCEKQVFSMSSCKKSKHLPYSQVDVQHVTSAWEILSSASHQTQVPLIGSLEKKLKKPE